jgi:hypothetical protein
MRKHTKVVGAVMATAFAVLLSACGLPGGGTVTLTVPEGPLINDSEARAVIVPWLPALLTGTVDGADGTDDRFDNDYFAVNAPSGVLHLECTTGALYNVRIIQSDGSESDDICVGDKVIDAPWLGGRGYLKLEPATFGPSPYALLVTHAAV